MKTPMCKRLSPRRGRTAPDPKTSLTGRLKLASLRHGPVTRYATARIAT
jgi:hypothetical protein